RGADRDARALRARGRAARPLRVARGLPSPPRRHHEWGAQLQSARDGTRDPPAHVGQGRLMGLVSYIRNIKDAAVTIADGMAVTFSHMLRKPYTIEDPERLSGGGG